MNGCRKAPIMTIGLNPNLSAFLPGAEGTTWAYPNFTSQEGTNEWAKYAWYYRYRTIYQERLDPDFVKKYILPEGQIIAQKDGILLSAQRLTDSPIYSIVVRYEGDSQDTTIELN